MAKQKLAYKGQKYEVETYPIDSGSNYDQAIHVRRIGDKTPFAGGNMKHSDNIPERAKQIIDNQIYLLT